MEFRGLQAQYRLHQEEILSTLRNVLERGDFIEGEEVKLLETELANDCKVKHCITCGNGTDALSLVLTALEIKEQDAVFVPDFTFFATVEVVAAIHATPVFVDVNPKTYNMDPNSLEHAIRHVIEETDLHPKAVIAVDLFGLPADYQKIKQITGKYNLKLIEDAAQGYGGQIKEQPSCSFADVATTSFFPVKPLGCYGDGGAIFTQEDRMAEQIRSLKAHGKGIDKYDNVRVGRNSRLDTIQAAILRKKLEWFRSGELLKLQEAAAYYQTLLQNCVTVPYIPKNFFSSFAQYTIQLKNREERERVMAALRKKEIPAMIYYRTPIHLLPAMRKVSNQIYDCTNSILLCQTVLSLPIHPYLKEEEITSVCKCIYNAL